MPVINVKVYRVLPKEEHDTPLNIEVAKSIVGEALRILSNTDRTFPRLNKYLTSSEMKIFLEYRGVNCEKEDLKYYAEVQSRAKHTAGISYWQLSIPVWQPGLSGFHHVIIQVPQDDEIILFMERTGLDQAILASNERDPKKLSWASADVRKVLGGLGGNRLGVLLSGSPGWDDHKEDKTGYFKSKNEGALEATLNDANLMFQLVHGLSLTNLLSGAVFGGLIKSKHALLDLLAVLRTRDLRLAELHIHTQKNVEGVLYVDSDVPGHAIQGGILNRVKIIPPSAPGDTTTFWGGTVIGAKFGPFVEIECERLVGPRHQSNQILTGFYIPHIFHPFEGDYAVLYYSGHGSKKGEIQIERDKSITPYELAKACFTYNFALLVVLDMCYAATFAEAFIREMKKYGIPSIVMCSVDSSRDEALSYESQACNDLWCFHWPIDIQRSDRFYGIGLYTAALSFGLLCIRELEIKRESTINISIQDFNDKVLRPICEEMSRIYNLPLQKPVVYST